MSHQRRRFEIELRPRTEVLGLESPRDLELVEIAGIDLVERRVAGVGEIAAIRCPLAVLRARLALDGERRPDQQTHKREETEIPPTNRVPHDSSAFFDAELIPPWNHMCANFLAAENRRMLRKTRKLVQYHRADLQASGLWLLASGT